MKFDLLATILLSAASTASAIPLRDTSTIEERQTAGPNDTPREFKLVVSSTAAKAFQGKTIHASGGRFFIDRETKGLCLVDGKEKPCPAGQDITAFLPFAREKPEALFGPLRLSSALANIKGIPGQRVYVDPSNGAMHYEINPDDASHIPKDAIFGFETSIPGTYPDPSKTGDKPRDAYACPLGTGGYQIFYKLEPGSLPASCKPVPFYPVYLNQVYQYK